MLDRPAGPAPRGRPLDRLDLAAAVGLLVLLVAYALSIPSFLVHPEEDAAMLLRYSAHLAAGKGVVWNVGEAPVDGATAFLFMLLVAGLNRAGLGLEAAAQGTALAAHWLAVLAVFVMIRRLYGASRIPALLA